MTTLLLRHVFGGCLAEGNIGILQGSLLIYAEGLAELCCIYTGGPDCCNSRIHPTDILQETDLTVGHRRWVTTVTRFRFRRGSAFFGADE